MHGFLGMTLYRLLLPVLFVTAFPSWVVKMLRRGGFGSGLKERLGCYLEPLDYEPCGAIHLHSVSVGETMLAVKLIHEWRKRTPRQAFVIATGTSTGHAVAKQQRLENVRVVYAPLDFRWIVKRYLQRFEPHQIVLVEGEAWPNLMAMCDKSGIPVRLINARMSPRSRQRYTKFAKWVGPVFRHLDAVAVQEAEDVTIWEELGVPADRVQVTGSLKFDPAAGRHPKSQPEFARMLSAYGNDRPIVLAASTHDGEEEWIATIVRDTLPEALVVIAPRHAERRHEVKSALEQAGFEVVLRSSFHAPVSRTRACLVIDSTGELLDWTAHAHLVIIGKSFLGRGGQNPCEGVLAGKPVIFGPHMENFEPLATHLTEGGGCIRVHNHEELVNALRSTVPLTAEMKRGILTSRAWLSRHENATARTIDLLERV